MVPLEWEDGEPEEEEEEEEEEEDNDDVEEAGTVELCF